MRIVKTFFKWLFFLIVCSFIIACSFAYGAERAIDYKWIGSNAFKAIENSYGKKILFNDGVFDCEDFVAAYFLEMDHIFEIPVCIYFGKTGHVMAGMISFRGEEILLVEPQDGRAVFAKTFLEAAKEFYPNQKFKIILIPYDVFMDCVQEPIK
jgi:hypothetical protein